MFPNDGTKNSRISSEVNDFKEVGCDYHSLLAYLEKKYAVVFEYVLDVNIGVRCLYLQDSYMKDWFNFFPDRLCIDITYKHFETDIFMYLFLSEDSNGRNNILSLGFSVSDDVDSLIWLLTTFKKHNPNWRRTKIIITDSEIKHRDLIRNIFPSPYVLICSHHALKSFKKGLDKIKELDAFPTEQNDLAMDLFKSMYFSHSQTEYELYYQQFIMLHGSIVSYFQEVWTPIQYHWRTELDFYHENIFYSLNLHLEYLDNTLKVIYFTENSLAEFLKKYFFVLNLKRKEKVNMVLYTNPTLYSRFSPEHQISKVLTPYAAKFVIDQFDLSSEILMDCSIVSDNYFFDNFGSPVNASASMCSCHFFLYTLLPCRHIFAVRKTLSLCIFEETLIEYIWSMKYYESTLTSLQDSLKNIPENVPESSFVLKDNLVSNILESALPVLCESSESVFNNQTEMLNQLVTLWKENKDVYLQFAGVENSDLCPSIVFSSENYFNKPPLPMISEEYKNEAPTCVNQVNTSMEKDNILVLGDKVTEVNLSANIKYPEQKSLDMAAHLESSSDPNVKKSVQDYNQTVGEISSKATRWNFRSRILDGKHINYAYLNRVICNSKDSCLNWLKQMELIPTSMMCPSCNCEMNIKNVPRLSDGAVWVCPNIMENKRSCSRRCSVRQGSWFELTSMSFDQILTFCYMWINGFNQSQIISETGVSIATYISWNKLNTRVCEEFLLEEENYSWSTKVDASSSAQVLEAWLKVCADEDSFLKFLQDANTMHRKDSIRHVIK